MNQRYRCWAEIDLPALRENLLWIRHRVGPGVKILTVVKADAYGHGLKQIAAFLMQSGTDVFGVANLAEAQAIRSVGRGWPILMLGACLPDETEDAVRDAIMPTLSSEAEARRFSEAARRQKTTVEAHVKVDTGMGRLGMDRTNAVELITRISRLKGLQIQGIFTHYAAAEGDAAFTRSQRHAFEQIVSKLQKRGVRPPLIHASNSAGFLHESPGIFNLVRPGLLVYGVIPPGKRRSRAPMDGAIHPVLSFTCRVGFVKAIPKGFSVGYGRTFVARKPMTLATLTAGYGDGYPRSASNKAEVLIQGRRCPVVGTITMDQTMVDVSALKKVEPGDEAVLIGRQGEAAIHAEELASVAGTVPWEIFTGISYRVPRVYRGGHAA